MLNLNPLTYPTPNDNNLHSRDPLGMLRMGSYDNNRFYYSPVHGKHHMPNNTNNIFNHRVSVGGNMSDFDIHGRRVNNPLNGVGLTINQERLQPFTPMVPSNSVLMENREQYKINALVDKPQRPHHILD